MLIILTLVLIVLIFLSAVLSASETSLFSLSSFTVKTYRDEKDHKKQLIAKLLQNPRELLVTILMLNILANILVQNTVSSIFGSYTSWLLKVGVPLGLTLFFGEIIPKSVALPNNKKISQTVAIPIAFFANLLSPIRKGFTKITTAISRIMFFFLKKEKPLSSDELQMILKTSQETGVLNHDEAELMRGYLDIHEKLIKEKMVPKDEILYFDIKKPLSELIHLLKDQQCSRLPVCDKDLDHILGIISAKNFFFYQEKIKKPEDVIPYLYKPFYVPESTRAWMLLRQLKQRDEELAMVVDEYGCINGLITQEDLVEAVVGEITDLRDEKKHYTRSEKHVLIASGKMELEEFENIFGVELPRKSHVATLGGWLIDQLEDIPQAGTKFSYFGFLFYILSADPNRIRRVYIRKESESKRKKNE